MSDFRIVYAQADGTAAVVVPAPGVSIEDALKAVPHGIAHEVVDITHIPADRAFRNAWKHDTSPAPEKIAIDMPKARDIAHEKRRAKRSEEFAPLDVEATIPAKAAQAEAKRQAIRDKYDAMQVSIDATATVDELKSAAADVL